MPKLRAAELAEASICRHSFPRVIAAQQLPPDVMSQFALQHKSSREKMASSAGKRPQRTSVVELDMLVEDDRALVVLDDIIAVQSVAIGVEIIFTFGAREFFGGQYRVANFAGLGRVGGLDRIRQHVDGIIGPRTLAIRDELELVVIRFGKRL